jgi:uncharacterized membrane protein YfcA
MKDSIFLLVAGLILAYLGWTIWHYLGDDAPWAITTIMLISVVADNVRLRRQLRSQNKG